jgi:hypothetical protein
VYSVSDGNEYQKNKFFWGVEHGQPERLTTSLLSVSQMSRQCGILNISQTYRPKLPHVGIEYFVIVDDSFSKALHTIQKIQNEQNLEKIKQRLNNFHRIYETRIQVQCTVCILKFRWNI